MLKKLFFFGFIFLFSLNFVSAWDYESSYDYGQADAYAKITGMYPECEGTKHGSYCAGRYYADISFKGDKFYIAYRATGWPNENDNGYSGQGVQRISSGRIYLDDNGQVPKYIICAWDYDEAQNGDWAWTGRCGGYLGGEYLDGLKNIECYVDSDCGNMMYCDKSGDWNQWSCINKECNSGETKCEGFDYYTCDSKYKWKEEGKLEGQCGVECNADKQVYQAFSVGSSSTETKCEGFDYYECLNYEWIHQGFVLGKCSVDCLSDEDCPRDRLIGERFCSSDENVYQILVHNFCSEEYKCKEDNLKELMEVCPFVCEHGNCVQETQAIVEKPESNLDKYGISSNLSLVIIITITIIFLMRWNK